MSRYSSRSRSRSYYDSDYGFPPYVPVAERRAKAAKLVEKSAKSGKHLAPVILAGTKITRTFWGNAWCKHLESYSDYENRLPRGRSYVRNGSVIDLQISKGLILAQVSGSSLYKIKIAINPLSPERWESIKKRCSGGIDSLIDLLKGKLSDGVMQIITDRDHGLFPAPSEIKKDCSCPDSAGLCKHLAAVLYGVGARLDAQPELLFTLRGVDHAELIAAAASGAAQITTPAADSPSALTTDQLSDVFGIDIDTSTAPIAAPVIPIAPAAPVPVVAPKKKPATSKKKPAPKKKPTTKTIAFTIKKPSRKNSSTPKNRTKKTKETKQ